MEVPESFRPKQDLESHVNNLLLSKKKSDETCLLILTKSNTSELETALYFWRSSWDKPYLLVKLPYLIWSICFFEEELYLGLASGAILKLPGEKFVAKRDESVASIHSHKNKIYDSNGPIISETLTNKLVDVRDAPVRRLYSYEGVLYNGGLYKGVFDTLKKKKVFDTDANVYSLFCEGQIFYAGTTEDIINLQIDEIVKERGSIVHVMGKHKDIIYDAGLYKEVFEDFSDNVLFDFKNEKNPYVRSVWDVTEVPLDLVEKLVNY